MKKKKKTIKKVNLKQNFKDLKEKRQKLKQNRLRQEKIKEEKAVMEAAEVTRKLSPIRVLIALLILAVGVYGLYLGWGRYQEIETEASLAYDPWYAAYVDVTSTPTYSFEQLGSSETPNVVLSFIVSSPEDSCVPTWGGYYTMDEASVKLDLDRRIARLQQQGGRVAVSFGGILNDELSVKCTDEDKLYSAYKDVIERYRIDTIDLDLESSSLKDSESVKRRADVIAKLQKERRADDKSLAVWLTLPVSPVGLTPEGTDIVSEMLKGGVDIAGVNVMTMDYGESKEGMNMLEASKRALIETHRQLGILYKQQGTDLSNTVLWYKVGATPMIGQNDVVDEVFTLKNAEGLNKFAKERGVGRMSMWSANRDVPCGENYVDTKVVSDSCSGVEDAKFSFAETLSKGFDGDLTQNAKILTVDDPESNEPVVDDPENSPYQIWDERGAYPKGVKVVWKGNVYEAKWWSKGDLPDNPVLQAWETPWKLIGPVLPGEKPIKQAVLPKGTYPEWSGTKIYEKGDRILFEGIPFEAKWWNQGDSPAASAANSDVSPWLPLTQLEIEEIIQELEK